MGKGTIAVNRENDPSIKSVRFLKVRQKQFFFYWKGQARLEEPGLGKGWLSGMILRGC